MMEIEATLQLGGRLKLGEISHSPEIRKKYLSYGGAWMSLFSLTYLPPSSSFLKIYHIIIVIPPLLPSQEGS